MAHSEELGKKVSILSMAVSASLAVAKLIIGWLAGSTSVIADGLESAGDVAASYADATLAARELGWHARLGIEAMCRDAWRWQSDNPSGYPD